MEGRWKSKQASASDDRSKEMTYGKDDCARGERREAQITAESSFYFLVCFLLLVSCGVGGVSVLFWGFFCGVFLRNRFGLLRQTRRLLVGRWQRAGRGMKEGWKKSEGPQSGGQKMRDKERQKMTLEFQE